MEYSLSVDRLPGVDAGFLYMETPSLHMHTLKVAVLDVSGVDGGYSFERLLAELEARLSLLPPFRQRFVRVPFGIHHPVVIEDPEFDVRRHLVAHRLPHADWADIEDQIGVIASTPLERSRPLWEIHAIEGLTDGRVVIVAKIHHSVADGAAAAALLANVMSVDPRGPDVPEHRWHAEPVPSRRALVRAALRDRVRELSNLPRLLVRTMRALVAVSRYRRQAAIRPPRPLLDSPKLSFNAALTPRRSFATSSLSLSDAKQVKDAFDVTLNDVVLAVVAGALRSWLDDRGERPAHPVTASVPVATDREPGRLIGNRVSTLFTSLATDIDDPVERLRRIAAITKEAKVVQSTLGLDMLESWVQYTPPGPFAAVMRTYSKVRAANLHRPPVNLVVSNVPGPREPLHVMHARLDDLYSVGPILEGIGLNITVWSYLDRMNFAAIACPDTLPGVRSVVARLAPALAELHAAACNRPALAR